MIGKDDDLVETDDFDLGIIVQKRNISSAFTMSEDSINVSFGQYNGPGPRYGIAPLPFQTNYATVSNKLEGASLRTSEDAATGTYPALTNRTKHLGIFAFSAYMNDGDGNTGNQRCFVIVSQDSANNIRFGIPSSRATSAIVSATSRYDGSIIAYGSYFPPAGLGGNLTRQKPSATLSFGVDNQNTDIKTDPDYSSSQPCSSAFWRLDERTDHANLGAQKAWARTAFMSVTGREFRITSLFAFGAGSNKPSTTALGGLSLSVAGTPSDYFYGIQKNDRSPLTIYGLQNSSPDWIIGIKFDYTSGMTSVTRQVVRDLLWNESHYSSATSPTISKIGGFVPNNVDGVYIADTEMVHKSDYKLFAVASDSKPIISIWRDDFQSLSVKVPASSSAGTNVYPDNKIEFFDASKLSYFKPVTNSGIYTEDGKTTSTVWSTWPAFSSSAASSPSSSIMTVGAANTGLLRANTTYEFTFSVFDKTLNYETNVGVPAKFRTGATDYVALFLSRYQTYSGNLTTNARSNVFTRTTAGAPGLTNVNFREFRVYYRALGTFEWLPAATVPAIDAFLYPLDSSIPLCQVAIPSLPGGQPGGFVDYSPLPDDKYIDVTAFQNRLFWLSRKSLHFSMRNGPIAYPVRNAVPCPKGEYLGFKPHAYPGQAEQTSRLVIFSTEETIVGRFIVGAELEQSVRLGPDTVGTFPVEGSNFIVDSWTSNTAFSGRAAEVADGVLYFWGPQGIYKDGGVNLPEKISEVLEPWIDGLVNQNNRTSVHCVFNAATSEVIWFFQPQAVAGVEQATQALVFHVDKEAWSYWTFPTIVIDSAQSLKDAAFQSDHNGLSGTRIILSIRTLGQTTSRPAFFDEFVFGQDMTSTSLYMVKEVTHPTGTTRKLIFQAGPTSIASKTGVALIAGYQTYTGRSETPDGIYSIVSSDSTSITVTRIDGSNDFPATTFNTDKYFPVWISSEHAFTFTLDSQYWAPKGLASWNLWKYAHTSARVDLLNDQTGTAYNVTTKYRALPATDFSTTTWKMTNNSRGNCQVFNSIPYTKNNASGQAIKINWSYTHPGGRWALQYLGVWISPQPVSNVRYWEG
jgi:hypothetical protein